MYAGRRWLTMMALTLVASAARAEEPVPPDDPAAHRTVITPGRSETSVLDSDRSVYTIDADAIEQAMPDDVPELLEQVPGAMIQRTNRGAGAPVLRGLIGPQNLILIDGLRYNNATFRTGPNQYLSLIDPAALDSVEVVLGPGSALYGSDAMGGVIQLLPRTWRLPEGPFGRASARFETVDLASTLSLDVGGGGETVAGWAGGSLRDHRTLHAGGQVDVPLSAYEERDWRARVGAVLSPEWTLALSYLGHESADAGRTDTAGRGDVRLYDNVDHFTWLDARYRGQGWLRRGRVALVYHRTEERAYRSNCATEDGFTSDLDACLALSDRAITSKRKNTDIVDGLGLLTTGTGVFLDGALKITAGAEGYFDLIGSARADGVAADGFALVPKARGNFSDGSTYLSLGAFLFAEGRLLRSPDWGELVLDGGARLSHVAAYAPDVPDVGDVDYDFTGGAFSAGLRWILEQRYNVYASYARGFRAPNLQETSELGDTGSTFEVPNPDLGPETSDTFEIGVKAFTDWFSLLAAYSFTVVADAIDRENIPASRCPEGTAVDGGGCSADGKPVVRRTNVSSATYHGIEAQLESARAFGWSAFTSVNWLLGDVEKDGKSQPARRVPPVAGRVGLRYQGLGDKLDVALFVAWSAAQRRLHSGDKSDLRMCEDPDRPGALESDCHGTNGWHNLGLHARYRIDEHLRVFGGIDNITDRTYRVHGSGFDAPGFDLSIGAALDL